MSSREKLGKVSISKLLFEFSLPATLGMLINAVYNIVTRIFIGNSPDLATNGLAAATIVFPMIMIIMAVAVMCGVGGSTVFSIALGKKEYDRIEKILANSFALAIITTAIISLIFFIFREPILTIFGASPEVLPYAKDYLTFISISGILQGIAMWGNNLIRADGSPTIAMLSILLGAIVNIILHYVFIFIFEWGMIGAGLATMFGLLTSAIWIIYYFTFGKSTTKLKLSKMSLQRSLALNIMVIGLPSFFIQFANSIWNTVLNTTIADYGGDIAISAMGIVATFQTLLLLPVIGVNQGALPIIGYNYGAKLYARVKETVKKSAFIATIICVIGFIIIRIFPEQIIMAFNQDPQLVELGIFMLQTWFLVLPIIGIGMVGSNYFQAIGKVKPAIFLTMSRQIFMLIPLILILARLYGLKGILHAAPIADVLSTILILIFVYSGFKKLGQEETDADHFLRENE